MEYVQKLSGIIWASSHVLSTADDLYLSVQNVFTQSLESGDRQKAMKRLRVPPLGEKVG